MMTLMGWQLAFRDRRGRPWKGGFWRGVKGLMLFGLLAGGVQAQERWWAELWAVPRELRQARREVEEIRRELARLPEVRVSAQAHGRVGYHGRPGPQAWVEVVLPREVAVEEVLLFPARVADPAPDDPVGGFPRELRLRLGQVGQDEVGEGRDEVTLEWRESEAGEAARLGVLRLPVPKDAGRFQRLRIEVTEGWQRGRGQFFTLGEVMVMEGGVNRALGARVMAGGGIETKPRWTAANLTDGFVWFGLPQGVERSPANGFHSRIEATPDQVPKWVEVDLGERVRVDEVRLVPARPADFADVSGFGFPPRFRVEVFEQAEGGTKEVVFAGGTESEPFVDPGDSPVCVVVGGQETRRVRVVAEELWRRTDDVIFALAELEVMSSGENVAQGTEVRFSDAVEAARSWAPTALVDGYGSQRRLPSWSEWLDVVERRRALEERLATLEERQWTAEPTFAGALGETVTINAGGKVWDTYNGNFREALLKAQEPDGSWLTNITSHRGGMGPEARRHFDTCLCTLMLEVYYRYLPVTG